CLSFRWILVCTQDRVSSLCLCTIPNTTQDIVVYRGVADSCQSFFSSCSSSFFAILAIAAELASRASSKPHNFHSREDTVSPGATEGRKIGAKSLLRQCSQNWLQEPFL